MKPIIAIVDGQPAIEVPSGHKFVGMEQEPNEKPRYGKKWHPWHNFPCYEIKKCPTEAWREHAGRGGPDCRLPLSWQ